MTIERRFDVPFVAGLALREKQIQQNYRPLIGVHKWFARRPGTLFRGLVLAEFGDGRLRDIFYRSNDLGALRVVDPFMGGGTPLIEANRVGCDVEGFDVNPMAAWIVREEMERIDLEAYQIEASRVAKALEEQVGHYYRTACPLYRDADVPAKSFLWIKTLTCEECGASVDLFPGFLVARDVRHPMNVLVCATCGELNEVEDTREPGCCETCGDTLRVDGPAKRGRCRCSHCGHENRYGRDGERLGQRLFAIEYYNPQRKAEHKGRFFKKPDAEDQERVEEATRRLAGLETRFVPEDLIPAGDETDRLHRWGYRRYRELFNARQLLGLELACRCISDVADERLNAALATNLSDLLRYQNMLCRYDTMALKTLDVFSVHGFPVGLVQCESNLLGISNGTGSVGSGGWSNIVQKYVRAKAYCENPYETRREGKRNRRIAIPNERVGSGPGDRRRVRVHCRSATDAELDPASVDAVFTDPPYFGNVQYAELMDFCYVWLRRLAGNGRPGFDRQFTRSSDELTGNDTASRGIEEFTAGLAEVYTRMALALKPGGPFVFTYHHNHVDAYAAIGVAILDAGFTCSATLPCPAEMGGSIHIHGTGSSIVDTVFVCRREADAAPAVVDDRDDIVEAVASDLVNLSAAGRTPTRGDARCVMLGHATRLAVLEHRRGWDSDADTSDKLSSVRESIGRLGNVDVSVARALAKAEDAAEREDSDPLGGAEKQLALSV